MKLAISERNLPSQLVIGGRNLPSPLIAAVVLVVITPLAFAEVLWQIGQRDHDFRDLAFSGELASYSRDFPDDVTFTAGQSDARQAFSAHHPGASDKDAGRREHPFRIRFDRPAATPGQYLLTIDLVDTEGTVPPTYRVTVNERAAAERVLEHGTGELSLLRPEKGKPQTLRYVISADQLRQGTNTIELRSAAGSWLLYDAITFEHLSAEADLPIELAVKPSVFFVEQAGTLAQEFTVTADGLGPDQQAKLDAHAGQDLIGTFALTASPLGTIQRAVHLPPTERLRELTFSLNAKERSAVVTARQTPQKKWRIYVAPTVHLDIGYTHLQRDIADIHNRNTDLALAPQLPSFFNQEGSWTVQSWLAERTPDRQQTLYAALRDHKMGLSGFYLNLLTGLCSEEELVRNLYYSARLHRQHDTPFVSCTITDVPSQVWSLPSILAGAGIRYLSVGVNDIRAPLFARNIHHKDPFWWEGPDGQRVLTWFAVGYGFRQAGRLGIRPEIERMRVAIEKELVWWDQRDDYPYDAIYFHGLLGDNQSLDPRLFEKIDQYNHRYAFPKVILCAPEDFFSYIEQHFADRVPTVRGCGGSWWEDGAGSSAVETAINRAAHPEIIAAETAWAIAAAHGETSAVPREDFDRAWENVLLYDEHTWGAQDSIAAPDSDFARRQWAAKARFATDALDESRRLLERGLRRLAERIDAPSRSVLAFNPSGQARTGVARVRIARDAVLVGDNGEPLPQQVVQQDVLREVEMAFLAEDVPPVGYKLYRLANRQGDAAGPPARFHDPTIENDFYRVTFDPASGGVVSLVDKTRGQELVDQLSPYKLGQVIYAAGGGESRSKDVNCPDRKSITCHSPAEARIEAGEHGAVFSSARSISKTYRLPRIEMEIVLYERLRRVDLVFRIDKEMTYDKEALYIAFPFAASSPRFRYEIGGASVRPNDDHFPGACRDWFAVQRWVTVADDTHAAALSPVDTPLITLCNMTPGKWLTELPITNGTVFAYCLNNYWCTNSRAGQDGRLTFRFSLTSDEAIAPADASRFGESVHAPLRAARVGPGPDTPRPMRSTRSFLSVEPANVQLTTLKVADDGEGLIVRVRETAGKDTNVTISTGFGGVTKASRCDLVERVQGPMAISDGKLSFKIGANGMAAVRLE